MVAIGEIESVQCYPYQYRNSSLNKYSQIKADFETKENYLKGETTISSKDVLNMRRGRCYFTSLKIKYKGKNLTIKKSN